MLDGKLPVSMEDLFFYKKERSLIEAREALARMQETKANLAKVSGIKNEAVLEKLMALNIRPETLTTLFAIPLVEVAWADGELQAKERDELFTFTEKAGSENKRVDHEIISSWLKKKPDPALLVAWEHYIHALCAELSEEERQALKEEVLADARKVAQAAGGLLGFGALSDEEKRLLARLEAAFG